MLFRFVFLFVIYNKISIVMKSRLYIVCLFLLLLSSCQEDIYPIDGTPTNQPQAQEELVEE